MKTTTKATVFLVLFLIPLLLSGAVVLPVPDGTPDATLPSPTRLSAPSYETHGPIWIRNDTAAHDLATAESWDGNGSPETPYVIEGYNITAVDRACLLIQHVTLCFEIRGCYISNVVPWTYFGIVLYDAPQISIVNTTIESVYVGVEVELVDSLAVTNCTFTDIAYESIVTIQIDGATIEHCRIHDTFGDGINLHESNNTLISDNQVSHVSVGSGIYVYDSDFVTILRNEIAYCESSGIFGIDSLNMTIEDNIIHDNWWYTGPMCGIHLIGSDYAAIVGNEIFHNARNGVYLYDSNFAYMFDNLIYDNSDHGVDALYSTDGIINQNNIFGNGWWPIIINALCGIYLGPDCNGWLVSTNQVWNNTPSGISVEVADDVEISNNQIYNNTDRGIYAYSYGVSEGLLIQENEVYGNGYGTPTGGISLYGYENSTITGNVVYNNSGSGIVSHGPLNNVTYNEVYDTIGHGINIEMTNLNRVENNIIHDNTEAGVFVYAGYTDVLENIVYDNAVGVHLYSSMWCSVYGNDIGWNGINALQELGQPNNEWYNGILDYGNWWSDHVPPTGEGIERYPITNGTDPVTYDIYPECSLNLTSASPISYEILETGNVLVWDAYAKNPGSYVVFIDGELAYSESWDGGPVELNVDGLAHGFHEVMLAVMHISGHGLGYESNVTVEDLTPPSAIQGPAEVSILLGGEVSVQYSSEDPSGVEWSVDDDANFAIDSTGLLTSIVDLTPGSYTIEITASDPYGHSVSLSVTVTVTQPGLPASLVLVVGAGAAVVVVIVLVTVLKKKGT